jgi:prolyl oligopeptidase
VQCTQPSERETYGAVETRQNGTGSPPPSPTRAVTDILHGVAVTDPYRWLEDQESPQTRAWLATQTHYARSYLDAILSRERIQKRIRELLDVETYDSIRKVGNRYFFRKRLPGQEQPCIFFREGTDGKDQLLIDPAERGTGRHTAAKPLRPSPDGRLLLYEIKEGGERVGIFELADTRDRKVLPDILPRGDLRGFAFAPDSRSFYYVLESAATVGVRHQAAYRHVLGTSFKGDQQIFFAGDYENLRVQIVPGNDRLGFLVHRFLDKTSTDFYVWTIDSTADPEPLIQNVSYRLAPVLLKSGRILAITDRDAANYRIVEVCCRKGQEAEFVDVIPAGDLPIQNYVVTHDRLFVSYTRGTENEIHIFDLLGKPLGHLPVEEGKTVRLLGGSDDADELLFEQESFTEPIQIYRHSAHEGRAEVWAKQHIPFRGRNYVHRKVWFTGTDGMRIPMFLVGLPEVFEHGPGPAIMTSYGGFGVSMTPQFSVLVAILMELGCLFALPNIRGGSEFGAEWHNAAKRRNKQVAFADFICAAEWLIQTGRTEPSKLAIFGGSHSGLLVGAVMTQRPDLFRAVLCMVPLLDMLRYHRFDNARFWEEEFGTSDDPQDFATIARYSPYHRVRDDVAYPATLLVTGDADQNCNSLHARKMTARLQAANTGSLPILLDYNRFRGHSPVLPLSERVQSLTDRVAFLCDQLHLSV